MLGLEEDDGGGTMLGLIFPESAPQEALLLRLLAVNYPAYAIVQVLCSICFN